MHKGSAHQGVNAPVQYGNGVKAYSVLLNEHFKLTFKKIQLLFDDLFGYRINESTVYSASEQCFEKLEGSEEIKTPDGKDVFLPNFIILKNPMFNYTIDGFLRYEFMVGITYQNNPTEAIKLILETVNKVDGV